MKMMSSTSITSMYGTTLISDLSLRRRPRMLLLNAMVLSSSRSARLALQDVREFLDEAFEADREAVDVVGEAVVRHHCRDRGEQADRGGDQRFGDAWGDAASVACCTLARPRKAFMMPHTVPSRPMYGDTEPTEARKFRWVSR
jgi:hypothetical protein